MKNIVKILPFALITAACGGGSDEDAVDSDYGEAIMGGGAEDGTATLTLAGETYDLKVEICPTANDAMSSDVEQVAIITGMAVNQDETLRLSVQGVKSSRGDQANEEATFGIMAKGPIVEGGASYRGVLPYAAFKGSSVSFKGVAQDPSRAATADVDIPVEFSIDCG